MKKILSTLIITISINCFSQTDTLIPVNTPAPVGQTTATPNVATHSTYKETPTWRAVFFNPNVYRSRLGLKGVIVGKERTNNTYTDSVYIPVNDRTKRFDYKIISEDFNGYVIIQVLPRKKFVVEPKNKIEYTETYRESTDSGQKVLTKVKVPSTTPYNVYKVIFALDSDNLNSDQDASKYYFGIKKDDFKPQSKILLSTKFVGIPLIHPFKFRTKTAGQGDDIVSSFTVSYNFGLRFKLGGTDAFKQNFVSLIPYGFGFGADKYFKKNPDGSTTADDKKDVVAITYYQGGILFTVQKVNFGIFAGVDKMIGNRKDWVYQDRIWFSFGLGYKLGDY